MTCVYGGSSTTVSEMAPEVTRRKEPYCRPQQRRISRESAGFKCSDDHGRKKVTTFDEAPKYLQQNKYIRNGYRVFLDTLECVKSVFWWSNETMNIWTHLLGFAFFLGLMVYDIFVTIPAFHPSLGEKVVMISLVVAYQLTMLLSVMYHVFSAKCENTYYNCLKWDVAGIIVSFAAIFISGIHYAFACFPGWKSFYEILIGCMSIVVLVTHLSSNDRSFKSDRNRTIIFCVWALFGVVPTGHWTYMEGGFDNPLIQALLPRVAVMYLLIAVAFFFYATRFPEVCCPGRVDFLGSSHQLWHVFIVVALYWWHETGIAYATYRQTHSCPQDNLVSVAQRLTN